MELTIDKRKKEISVVNNFKFNYWDLCYWQNNSFQINNETDIARLLNLHIKFKLNSLYNYALLENFKIDVENNQYLDNFFKNEINLLKLNGNDELVQKNLKNSIAIKTEYADFFAKKQLDDYKNILNILSNSQYCDSFKCLILNEILNKYYHTDFSSNNPKMIVEKRMPNQTIYDLLYLSKEMLDYIYFNAQNYSNFKKLYFDAQIKNQKNLQNLNVVDTKYFNTYGKGKWLKFDSKINNGGNFNQNLAFLKSIVIDTPWCTNTLANKQLSDSDFYIFVDNDNKPHIAIKIKGNFVEEVRGIQNGNAQELENYYRDVAIDFLKNNKNLTNGKKWLDKEEWNARLVEYNKKINDGSFKKDLILKLFDDLLKTDNDVHGDFPNSNLLELKKSLKKVDYLIAEYFNCSKEQVYFGNYNSLNEEVCPYAVIIGNANFSNTTSVDDLIYVLKDVYCYSSKLKNLGKLKTINGNANFSKSKIQSLGNLTSIKGNANFSDSEISDLGDLISIKGDANFSNTNLKNLGKLMFIGGEAIFTGSSIKRLNNLMRIGGSANFSQSMIEMLDSLEYIGGNANFKQTKNINLGSLKTIKDGAYFQHSKITDLYNLEYIGGFADFSYSDITDFGRLSTIEGSADFESAKATDLGNINVIRKVLFAKDSNLTDLKNLRQVDTIYSNYGKIKQADKLVVVNKIFLDDCEYSLEQFKNQTKENIGCKLI